MAVAAPCPVPRAQACPRAQVLDEICLEGLDGITLQALWVRLAARPGYGLGLDRPAREFLWEIVHSLDQVRSLLRMTKGDQS
jgi:hypothetical protein